MSDAEERTAGATTAEQGTGDAGTTEPAAEAAAEGSAAGHPEPVCQVAWCPICFAVGAVQPIQPEVVEHLLRAGTEMLMAFRSVLDARVGQTGEGDEDPGPTRLEKIDLG
jgi:hypothetical protein